MEFKNEYNTSGSVGVKVGVAEMPLSQQRTEFKQVLPRPQRQRNEGGKGVKRNWKGWQMLKAASV